MKNVFLAVLSALALAACGGASVGTNPSTTPPTDGGGENPPAPLTDVISKPTISCGGTDCLTGASSLALKGDIGALSSNAGYYASLLPDYYDSLKTPLSTLNADLDMMNTLLKNGGYATCGAIPASGTLQHPSIANFSVEFKAPLIDLDMGTGHGQIHAEKRLIVSKNGTQEMEIEVHCGGGGPLQTVHIVWLDNGGHEHYNFAYEYDTATKRIALSGAAVWEISGGQEWRFVFGLKDQADGGFGFYYYDSLDGSRNFVIGQTAPGAPQKMEYAAAVDSSPANSVWTPDFIAYGSDFADDFERVCALGFRSSSPTYSVEPTDCGTSVPIAIASDWPQVVGFSSGSGGWTSDYLDGLFLRGIQN